MASESQDCVVKKWNSRFGYLMVAIGASIGLGNVWKFPYLAYRGGGAVFLVVYIIVVLTLAKPMVEMETSIGRHGKSDTVTVFEVINPKWGIIGWIANICTLMINFYYVVVGGWVLKYAYQFIFIGDFGEDVNLFYKNFISDPIQPIIWSSLLLLFVAIMLLFGITNYIEKISKIIMPAFFIMLFVCGIYACVSAEGAIEGLKYYLLPDFSNFSIKVFADAVTQVLFSVGIGWGIFTTLGSNVPKSNNIRKDALFICFSDTSAAILAGFTIIPAAFGANIDVQKGPSLIFDVMAGIFLNLPGGRFIGSFFFVAIALAVISSLFSFIEISVRTFEIKKNMGRKKAVIKTSLIIMAGNIIVSLGFGVLSMIKIPWLYVGSIEYYSFYDWFDCFSGYVLLPLGCLLTCYFTIKVWGWKNYEKELTENGRDGRLTVWDKVLCSIIVPAFMIIVILNVFGVIR